jgi:ABC-type multidrug transport system ATPase subunit
MGAPAHSLGPAGPEPATHGGAAVVADHVVKRFEGTIAVDDVSFTVQPGELFGFIGPDGAGKTTLIRIMATLLVPDQGSCRILGQDVVKDMWALRRRVGYMPGRFSLYGDLSVEENLRFFAAVFGTTIEREIEQIAPIYSQIEPFRERHAGALSGGMKQKLALCCALVHRPEILYLDEPSRGVDAVSRREFWDLLAQFKASGLTIIVSTPYMDEADRCDRVAFMDRGRILLIDAPPAITRSFDRPLFGVRALRVEDRYRTLVALRDFQHRHTIYPFGETLHYTDERPDLDPARLASELRAYLGEKNLHEIDVSPIPATIEDCFMARMGRPDGGEAP